MLDATVRPDSEEVAMVRESVTRFCDDRVAPHYMAWERAGIVPRSLWSDLGAAGFLNCDIAEDHHGHGGGQALFAAVVETFSRLGYGAIAGSMIGVHSGIVAHYIANHGTESQRRRYLPGMTDGSVVGAIAMTEPGAGSDLQGIRAKAVRDGEGWRFSGQKTFISNGQHCDVVIVAARTNPDVVGAKGTTLFLVDAEAAGFSRGRNLDKIGQHAADTSELFFDDVRLPADAVLGQVDDGFSVLMAELPRERLMLAQVAIAATEGMIDWTVEYMGDRAMFGRHLKDFQVPRHRVADMVTRARVTRAFVDLCAARLEEGTLDTASASMAKLAATELQWSVADDCVQLHGGYGYMTEYPIARAFVDARVQRIYGGTSEIMREIIAKAVLGR